MIQNREDMQEQDFIPYQIIEVELSQPLQTPRPEAGYTRQPVLALVRLHTYPLGVVELDTGPDGPGEEDFARRIWQETGEAANQHLVADGLAAVSGLTPEGIRMADRPRCLEERERFLENAPYASVLVATHNRIDTLGPCLDSLLAMDYPNFDIVVIDNAPSDEETAKFIIQNYRSTGKVRYVREEHAGLASAHNRGLAATRAAYIAITDDDVTVDRNWLTEIMMSFTRAENVGCVTGMIFPAEISTRAQYWLEQSVGYAKGYQARPFNMNGHRPDSPLFPYAAGMFGSGANMAFKSEVIRALGGFDDSLGAGSIALGGDDLAAFYRVVAGGYTLVYQPAAIIYHQHHREYERLRKTAYGYGAGLTAYLTGVLLDRPGRAFDLARKAGPGLRHAFGRQSAKNARQPADYPAELKRMERKGMLAGPLLYLRSRWNSRGLKQKRASAIYTENRFQEMNRGS